MDQVQELTINWERCIYVDDLIDDGLVRKLTPSILALRQVSNDPITVAINSPGGSLSSMDALLGLLGGPNQDKRRCPVITVATHKAYSAAAILLASGDYSVAMPHSEVLFHDVRYGGMEDVTPDVALRAARQLQVENEGVSLKLANHVFKRLMWNYIDLKLGFDQVEKDFPAVLERYQGTIENCGGKSVPSVRFDPARYATVIFSHLRKSNETIINAAMVRLRRWGAAVELCESMPMYSTGAGELGLLDGCQVLFRTMLGGRQSDDFGGAEQAESLRLVITLMTAHLATQESSSLESVLEKTLSDYKLVSSLNDPKHKFQATKLMLRNANIFFNTGAARILEGNDDFAREKVIEEAAPLVSIMWHICVLVCRELFNGEHILKPSEAQILGLVDEVPGLETLGSRRDFRVSVKEKELQKAAETQA